MRIGQARALSCQKLRNRGTVYADQACQRALIDRSVLHRFVQSGPKLLCARSLVDFFYHTVTNIII